MPKPFSRREVIQVALGGTLVLTGAGAGLWYQNRQRPQKRGNAVLVLSGGHHANFAHGQPVSVSTEHMRLMLRFGIQFQHAYAPSTSPMASLASFLTGARAHQVPAFNDCPFPTSTCESFAGLLAQQGVHTVLAASRSCPLEHPDWGFTERIYAPGSFPVDCSVDRSATAADVHEPEAIGQGESSTWREDSKAVQAAVEWITRNGRSHRPFVLVVALRGPAESLQVPEELWKKYAYAATLPEHDGQSPAAKHPYTQRLREYTGSDAGGEAYARKRRRAYCGAVERIDSALGSIVSALHQSRSASYTVCMYTSTQGDMLGKFGVWGSHGLYEDAARIPLYATGPGFKRDYPPETPVDLHDVRATLFAATGCQQPEDWLGTPLQNTETPDRFIFSEYHGPGSPRSLFMVRRGPWKLIWNTKSSAQLFNISNDPEELVNVAALETEVCKEMETGLREIVDPDKIDMSAAQHIEQQLEKSTL